MKLHHKSKRTLHFQKGDVCPFCDAAEESLKHSYSDYPVGGMCLFRGMPAVRMLLFKKNEKSFQKE